MSVSETIHQSARVDPLGKLLHALVLAAIIGLWQKVDTSALAVARQEERALGFERQLVFLANDRYTKSEAQSDRALTEQRLSRLEQWNGNLSERLRNVEQTLRERAR